MRPQNLLSVYQGAEALENFDIPAEKKIKRLKRHEIRNLRSFCNEMLNAGCHLPDLDGFFVGYTIQQIGKEFDLLRLLLENQGRVFTRQMLLDRLWDFDTYVEDRIVDSHIKNLRKN